VVWNGCLDPRAVSKRSGGVHYLLAGTLATGNGKADATEQVVDVAGRGNPRGLPGGVIDRIASCEPQDFLGLP
jgi:hypothetical protein